MLTTSLTANSIHQIFHPTAYSCWKQNPLRVCPELCSYHPLPDTKESPNEKAAFSFQKTPPHLRLVLVGALLAGYVTAVALKTPPTPISQHDAFLHGLYRLPADLSHPSVIARRIDGDVSAGNKYYDLIDRGKNRTTLDDFQKVNGFNAIGASDINTRYANTADLGIGRDMHCIQNKGNVACYVGNYAPKKNGAIDYNFNDKHDADAAVYQDPHQRFATVAMEYSPIEIENNGLTPDKVVKFYVYDGDGRRIVEADLDGNGRRANPELCVICHGGRLPGGADKNGMPKFSTVADVKFDAQFLPFDLRAFTFSDIPGWTKNDQQFAFKRLNQEIVFATKPNLTVAIDEIIHSMYPNNQPSQEEFFVVAGWNQSSDKAMYWHVIATCRTCHSASPDKVLIDGTRTASQLQFTKASDVTNQLGSIEALVCSAGVMPHALKTFNLFWNSEAPSVLQAFGDQNKSFFNGWLGNQCGVQPPPDPFKHDEFKVINIEQVLQKKCAWCHYTGNSLMTLQQGNSATGLINLLRAKSILARVELDPDDPSFMPKGCVGDYCLTPAEIGAIRDWVKNGALPCGVSCTNVI